MKRYPRLKPDDVAKKAIQAAKDIDGFEVDLFPVKGRGIRTTKSFNQGDFLLEYSGTLISSEEGHRRENNGPDSTFRYFFMYKGKEKCIDSTAELSDGPQLGRLVNHGRGKEANAHMKVVEWQDIPHLCLFASANLSPGCEVLYDYGLKDFPWEKDPTVLDKKINSLEKNNEKFSGKVFGFVIPILKNGEDGASFPIEATLCLFGSSADCDIIMKCKNVKETECSIEVNNEGQMFLTHGKTQKQLKHKEEIQIASRTFRIEYPTNDTSDIECVKEEELNQTQDIHEQDLDTSFSDFDDDSDDDASYKPDDDVSGETSSEEEYLSNKNEEGCSRKSTVGRNIFTETENQTNEIASSIRQKMTETHQTDHAASKEPQNNVANIIEPSEEIVPDSETEISSDEMASSVFPQLSVERHLMIQKSSKTPKNKIDNKKHACTFCRKLYPNIARHLTLKHGGELEVGKILALPKKSKERRKAWELLVNRGDFNHNYCALEKGRGVIIPKYRTTSTSSIKNYVPCQHCRGFYNRTDLWKHRRTCEKYITSAGKGSKVKFGAVAGGKLLLPVAHASKELHEHILVKMKDDNIKAAIGSDKLILEFGNRLYDQHGNEKHKFYYISTKMRELGRLLLKLKETDSNVECLQDCIHTSKWDSLIQAVKAVAGYNSDSHHYTTPSLALKLGHSVKKIAEIMHFNGLKYENTEQSQQAANFIEMYKYDWTRVISSKALSTLDRNKYNKPQILPLVEDVVTLNRFLKAKANKLSCTLKDDVENVYPDLAKVCLTQIILFNRKRSGEAERMTLSAFLDARKGGQVDPMVKESLTVFEQKLCESHTRVEIVGKRGRKVPVLLTDDMKKHLLTLVEAREKVSISKDNIYLFARPGDAANPYRGSDCLRIFAKMSGSRCPSTLTSTKLRKQLATLSQILNLSNTSQDILAAFQGHDIRIHRQFYRLPEDTLQVAKVSKILHCINDGTVKKYKGLDFDEIHFNDQDIVESESDESADECDIEDEDISHIPKGAVSMPEEKRQRKKNEKRPWTDTEMEAVENHLGQFVQSDKLPGKFHCLEAMRKAPILQQRPWEQIKFYIKNLKVKRLKKFHSKASN